MGFNIVKCEIEEFEEHIKNLKISLEKFLCTKKGVKDMIKLIEKYPSECVTITIDMLNTNLITIMKDCSGNYFCQKLIQHSNPTQIYKIIDYIKESFVSIAEDYQGTHVLQALIQKITNEKEEMLILNSIKGKEIEMAFHGNASHVLQKIMAKINEPKRIRINEIVLSNFNRLSIDSSGVCILKIFIYYSITPYIRDKIINIIENNCIKMSNDPFGNYIIQDAFNKWGLISCKYIVSKLIKNICSLSVKRFSSNVAEKLIEIIDEYNLQVIFKELFRDNKFPKVIRNKYGRYVIQKSVERMTFEQKSQIYNLIVNDEVFCKNDQSTRQAILSCLFQKREVK